MQNYLQAIEHEVNRAKGLFSWDNVDLNLAVVILTEEVGEAAKAAIDYQFKGKPIQDLRDELIQTAAMAIRTLELIEGYPDTKVTAATEPSFKVGDRVQMIGGYKQYIIQEILGNVALLQQNSDTTLQLLTDLTLITE
jgi:NTP pyrophosphatase (non-canonical NTP hydrolase)